MKRIWTQCIKELAQFQRDRLTVALAIALPLATLIIFGFAIRLETQNIPIVIQDYDNSPLSRTYIEQLFATNQFQLTSRRGSSTEAAIASGIAKAGVIIPPDFSQKITSNTATTVQVLIDGTDANNARVVQNSIRATTNAFLKSAGLQRSNPSNVVARTRLWFNPGRKEKLYIVPGVFGVILWIYPSLLAAIAMVREKERETILQVYASDMSAAELLLGKGLAYLIVGIAEAFFIILLGSLLFQVGFVEDPIPFLVGTLIFLGTSVMFGLLIGVRVTTQNTAVQVVATTGFLSALLLSGFIYPLSNIPFPLSLISNILPVRYYIELSRDAFVRGTGWTGVWWILVVLILLCFLLFNAARRVLSRMQLNE